jgi:hypothetical protein
MTAHGHTKRRILLTSMWYGFRAQSALLVQGSSRRIMTLRFRPANIRVINRRDSLTAVLCPVFQNERTSSTRKREELVRENQAVKPFGLDSVAPYQKLSLRPNWISRGVPACDSIRPKSPVFTVAAGTPKLG